MREIKFRQPILNQWGMFNRFHYWGVIDGEWVDPVINGWENPSQSEQFTGLKDKNGVDIYEGDMYKNTWGSISIITHKITDSMQCTGHGCNDRFIESGFKIGYCPDDLEVIGNIHKNKELLKC